MKWILLVLGVVVLGCVVVRFIGYKLEADREDRDAEIGVEP